MVNFADSDNKTLLCFVRCRYAKANALETPNWIVLNKNVWGRATTITLLVVTVAMPMKYHTRMHKAVTLKFEKLVSLVPVLSIRSWAISLLITRARVVKLTLSSSMADSRSFKLIFKKNCFAEGFFNGFEGRKGCFNIMCSRTVIPGIEAAGKLSCCCQRWQQVTSHSSIPNFNLNRYLRGDVAYEKSRKWKWERQ